MASKLFLLCAAFALANGDVSHLPGYAYNQGASTNYVSSSHSVPVVAAGTTRSATYTTGSTGFGAGHGAGLSGFGTTGYSTGAHGVGLGGVGKTVTTTTTHHGAGGAGLGVSGFGARSGFISGSSTGSAYNTGSVGGFGDATRSAYTVSAAPSVGLRSGYTSSGGISSGHSSSGQYHTGFIPSPDYSASLHFDAANVGTSYSGGASGGVSEQFHGQQQEPIITKNFYFFSGPEDHSEAGQVHHVTIGRPEKNLKVIFIKNPSSSSNRALIKAHHAPHEEKTVVYVLSKHDNDLQIDTQIDEVAPTAPVKPDVVFVKYKNNEEIQHLQEEVKSKLQHIAGHVHVSDEGAAPVRSITHETHGAGGVIGSGSTTYSTSSNLGGVSSRSGFGDASSTYTVGSVAAPAYTVGDASTTYTTTSHLGGATGRSGHSGTTYTVGGGSGSGSGHYTTGGSTTYSTGGSLGGVAARSGLGGATTTVTKTTTTGGSAYESAPLLHGLVGLSGSASEGSSVAVAPASSSTTYEKTTVTGSHDVPLSTRSLTETDKKKEISRVIESTAKLLTAGTKKVVEEAKKKK